MFSFLVLVAYVYFYLESIGYFYVCCQPPRYYTLTSISIKTEFCNRFLNPFKCFVLFISGYVLGVHYSANKDSYEALS